MNYREVARILGPYPKMFPEGYFVYSIRTTGLFSSFRMERFFDCASVWAEANGYSIRENLIKRWFFYTFAEFHFERFKKPDTKT